MAAEAAENGIWLRHPSFYKNAISKVETENMTFYLALQQPFSSSAPDYLAYTATLFFLDHRNPNDGIRSLSALFPNLPLTYKSISYDEEGKQLVAKATDGSTVLMGDNIEPIVTYDFDFADEVAKGTVNLSAEEINSVNAPRPFIATHMALHPELGLIVTNHGINNIFDSNAPAVPLFVSAYKNGKWTDLSPISHLPSEISSNASLAGIVENAADSYPLTHPDGLALNPQNPDFAYFGSMTGGWIRINLSRPEAVPLHVATSTNQFASLPGFVADAPVMSQWSAVCDFSAPAFDSDGNLWMLFYDQDESFANAYSMSLSYFTPDQLKEMEEAEDPAKYVKPHKMTVMTPSEVSHSEFLLPLLHPDNKNIIAMHTGSYSSPIILLDHNGTPENLADDRIVQLNHLFDSNTGAGINFSTPATLWEDPFDGTLWVSNMLGTFKINPALAFSNPDKAASKHLVKSGPEGNRDKRILDTSQANAFATDGYGRLWIGTDRGGLMCLSADRSQIEAQFNIANSPLLSNRIFGLVYNSETNSMMISTGAGLMEYVLSPTDDSRLNVSVNPLNVFPDFHGPVTVSGLPDNNRYVITDSEGNIVAGPFTPINGVFKWNPEDFGGKKPVTGVYEVRNENKTRTYAKIRVLN